MLAWTRQPGPGSAGPGLERAADGGQALLHADQAVAAARCRAPAAGPVPSSSTKTVMAVGE